MKKVLYVLLALVVLYLILAMVGPSHVKVERKITINKPAETVRKTLGDFSAYNTWSPWSEKDTAMKTTISGNAGEVGHHYEWSGNKEVGKGSMEIVALNGDSINQKLSFGGRGEAESYYIVSQKDNASEVTWGMHMNPPFLFRPMMMFGNMDKMVGTEYEKGLAKLKTILESMEEKDPVVKYEIEEQNWDEKTFASTKHNTMNGQECNKFFGENWSKMRSELEKSKITPTMGPSAIFYSWDEKTMMTECAAVMCVPNGSNIKGWEKCTVPPSKVLHIAYHGDPGKSMDAHMAMEDHMKTKGFTKNMVIEEYVTDPMVEKDSTKWLTNIYYVLR